MSAYDAVDGSSTRHVSAMDVAAAFGPKRKSRLTAAWAFGERRTLSREIEKADNKSM
jgi:hypothetical protein